MLVQSCGVIRSTVRPGGGSTFRLAPQANWANWRPNATVWLTGWQPAIGLG